MKALALAALALGATTSVALAEPMKLTDGQLDQLTAAGSQSNSNTTVQVAYATAAAGGGCNVAICVSDWGGGNGNASAFAVASNFNDTHQSNDD